MAPRSPAEQQSVTGRLTATLQRAIVSGKLRPGEALPSERALAEQHEVNRSTVREALRRLEALGLITVRQGGATRVAEALLSTSLAALPELVASGGRLGLKVQEDLHELRGLLLGFCAERAAHLADPASVARLEQLAAQLAQPGLTPTAAQALDFEFFEQLVRVTGNQLLLLFTQLVKDVYFRAPKRFLGLYGERFSAEHHARAVAAIRARDAQSAGEALRAYAASALSPPHRKAH